MFSFTLQVKTEGYKRSRNTRVYLCASSPDESGSDALEWCLEALVQDGDELIVFRGVDEDVFGMQSFFPVSRLVVKRTLQTRITTSLEKRLVNLCEQSKREASNMTSSGNFLSFLNTFLEKSPTPSIA